MDGGAQAFQQQGFGVVGAFLVVAALADVGAKGVGVAQFAEEGDGVVLDGGFVEGGHIISFNF